MRSTRLARLSSVILFLLAMCACAMPRTSTASVGLSHPDGYWATPSPPLHSDHAAVYIPNRDLIVVVAQTGEPTFSTEVWALPLSDGDAWIRLAEGGPTLGPGAVAVYDPVDDRILVHGGLKADGRTWALRIDPEVQWSALMTAPDGPGVRWEHTAVYDSRRRRVIVFGGLGPAGVLGDAWELRLQGARPIWTRLGARGTPPGARAGHAAVYDPRGERMILVGGGGPANLNEVWELSLRRSPIWREIPIAGGPGAARSQHTVVFEPTTGNLILHGGLDGTARNDIWELALDETPNWTPLSPTGRVPPARAGHVAVFDPRRGRMVVAGGSAPQVARNETWALELVGERHWNRLAPAPESPPSAYGQLNYMRSALDTRRGRLFVLTHLNEAGGQTWVLSFAPDPHWSRVVDAPTRNQDGIYDSLRDRLVIHGGFNATTGRSNLTWELPLGQPVPRWVPLSTGPVPPPPPRMDHVVAYDSRRDRMAVFGGSALIGSCSISVDTYLLSLGGITPAWSPVVVDPFPDGGRYPVGVYDEANDRLIVHGGLFGCRFPSGYPGGYSFDGTWALDLANPRSWTRLVHPAEGPGEVPDAAYDPLGRRMVVVRPRSTPGFETWVLPLDPGSEEWRQLTPRGVPPSMASASALDYDAGRDRFVLVTSAGSVGFLLPSRIVDASPLSSEPPAVEHTAMAALPAAPPAVRLEFTVQSNPAHRAVALSLSIPRGESAVVELYDVRGRLQDTRWVASGTIGDVVLDAANLRPGVYFVRLRQGSNSLVRKLVLAL